MEERHRASSPSLSSSGMRLSAEQHIGKYRIVRDLGVGGMAQVFLASLDGPDGFAKPYVVKRILPEYSRDEQFARMFVIEAKVAALLDHPNVVHAFEFGLADGDYYLVMEYVAGASLERIMRAARKQGIPLGVDVAVEVGLSIANALAYAHGLTLPDGTPLDLVHRDVSPGNVLISLDGAVKLTDFGVVKTSITATVSGLVKGKWSYMSPEQITGQPVDARSDLFSLGIVLYELITGQRLFRADSVGATAFRVMQAVVPPPSLVVPDLDPRFEAILMKALARDLESRYQSAAELAADLEEFRASRLPASGGTSVGSVVRTLFPDGTPFARGASVSDAPPAASIEPGMRAGGAESDDDIKVRFEPESPARVEDGIPWALILAILAACVLASEVFWYLVS